MGLFSSNKHQDEDEPSTTGRLRRKSQSRRSSTYIDDSQPSDAPRRYSTQPPAPPVSKLAYRRDSAPVDMAYYNQGSPQQQQQQQHPEQPIRQAEQYANSGGPGQQRDYSPVHGPGYNSHSNSPQYQQQQPDRYQQQGGPPRDQFQHRPDQSLSGSRGSPAGGRPASHMAGGPGSYQGHQQQQQQGANLGSVPQQQQHAPSPSAAGSGYNPSSRSQSNHSPAPSQQSSYQAAPSTAPGLPSPVNASDPGARGPPIRRGSSSSTGGMGGGPSQQLVQRAPSTIAGEPLHDLDRAVGLLKSSKFYAEGFLMKKVEVGSDGKAHPGSPDSEWAKWFVQLSGTIMSTWNAAEMDEAARQNRTVPPQYLNLSDAFLHPYPPPPNSNAPTSFQFALNSAGLNRLLFCAPSLQSLTMWINAIRLAGWERSRCNEIYTGTLLGLREPKPQGWLGYEGGLTNPGVPGSKGKFEGWLKIRLPGDTEWRRIWTVVLRGSGAANAAGAKPETTKKAKRSSLLSFGKKADVPAQVDDLPGDGAFSTIAFYGEKPTKKEQPLCIAQHIFYAAAIYPESEKLIDRASLFKIEGTFLNPNDGYKTGWGVGGRAEKQGYALLMLEEGNYQGMLEWIVGLADAFKLYGRPRGFSYDPRDPSSMYFALPVGPHRDRQFLDRELVDNLDINESRPRAIRAVFHNILFDRMRGIRPAALGAPGNSRSGSPAQRGVSSAPAPQLAPVESAGPLKVQNGDYEEEEPPRRFQQRNESPKLSLPPIGEGSVVSEAAEPAPASRDLEREQWERQQREGQQREEEERRQQHEEEQRRLQQQEREQQRSQPPPQPTQDISRSNGGTPDYLGGAGAQQVDASRLEPSSMGHSEGDRRLSSTGEHLATYSAFLSSDLLREPTPPPPSAQRNTSSPPVVNPIVTSGEAHRSPSSPNYSRPTPLMRDNSLNAPLASASEAGATHITYNAPPAGLDGSQRGVLHDTDSRSYSSHVNGGGLASPGAPSTAAGTPVMERGGSDVGLAYLAPGAQQHQVPSHAVDPEPVVEKKAEAEPARVADQPQATERSALAEPREAGAASLPLQEDGAQRSTAPSELSVGGSRFDHLHNGNVVDSPENSDFPSSTHDTPYSTQPLFSPPKLHQETFGASNGDDSRDLSNTHADQAGSPIIPPKSPGRDRRPSPVIDTAGLPGASPRFQPQQAGQQSLAAPAPAVEAHRDVAAADSSMSPSSGAQSPYQQQRDGGSEEHNIHSDLLAALHFVDRSESPPPPTPQTASSVEPSPIAPRISSFHVGPPKRGIFDPSSPADEQYGFDQTSPSAVEVLAAAEPEQQRASPISPAIATAPSASTQGGPTSFPSSFAPNKRAEERVAAAKLAEQAQQAALTRPGRTPGAANKGKQRAWVDSDEDEDEPEEEDDSDDDAGGAASKQMPASASAQQDLSSRNSLQPGPRPTAGMSPHDTRRSYYENGPSPENRISPLPSPHNASPLPSSPSKGEFHLHGEGPPPTLKPVVSPHGLLHAGIIDKKERSARALEHQARDTGGPLVNLPSKPPPPQTGLVGAITSHQREKERTGGVGRALTEQQRERKLAEQRQKQLDEMQRQQLQFQQQRQQMMYMQQMGQFGGGNFGSMGGMPMGMGMGTMGTMGFGGNPWMMGGGGGGYGAFGGMSPPLGAQGGSQMGMPSGPSPAPGHSSMGSFSGAPASPGGGMDPQQQHHQQQQQMMAAQMAAQAAAQAAYQQALSMYSSPPSASPGGSPSVGPQGYPSMNFSQAPFYPSPPAMHGSPAFSPYGFNPQQQSQWGGSMLGHGQQPSFGGGMGAQHGAGEQSDSEEGGDGHQRQGSAAGMRRVASPLDLNQTAREE